MQSGEPESQALLACHICGKTYTNSTLESHITGCTVKWQEIQEKLIRNNVLRGNISIPSHPLTCIPSTNNIDKETIKSYNDEAQAIFKLEALFPCSNCNNRFDGNM